MSRAYLFAQFSDLHIKAGRKKAYGVVDTAQSLERAVAHLVARSPAVDALLLTGDLVDHGRAEDYALLREILQPWLALAKPTHVVMGNHDAREALTQAFADFWEQPPTGYVHYAAHLAPDLRLLVLDTVVAGQGGGRLCEERLAWLEAMLRADQRPTLLAMHHPPFDSGIAHMDIQGLEGRDDLEAMLARHPHAAWAVCGHLHRGIAARVAQTLVMCAPSTAHQVALDFSADGPDCFVMEPPGYLLHRWHAGRLTSHTVAIGHFDGPYRFREDGRLID